MTITSKENAIEFYTAIAWYVNRNLRAFISTPPGTGAGILRIAPTLREMPFVTQESSQCSRGCAWSQPSYHSTPSTESGMPFPLYSQLHVGNAHTETCTRLHTHTHTQVLQIYDTFVSLPSPITLSCSLSFLNSPLITALLIFIFKSKFINEKMLFFLSLV